ncbi:MAG: hypothetical protein HOV81_15320 [Kofleriaceae bacterium]|nr:hypothetical protein [Kofleriaceae bacterium]
MKGGKGDQMARCVATALVWCVTAIGCGQSVPQPVAELPYLESLTSFKSRAAELGCVTGIELPPQFECAKRLQPCGCTILLKAISSTEESADKRSVALVNIDIFGCPNNSAAVTEALALVDPILPSALRDSFHQFANTPRVRRDPAEEAKFAAFQTGVFAHVHARVLFGATTDMPRHTIWLDRYSPGQVQALVPDAPTYGECETGIETQAIAPVPTQPHALGFCDQATSSSPPCDFGKGRWPTRGGVSAEIGLAQSWWGSAASLLGIAEKIRQGTTPFDTDIGRRVSSTLFAVLAETASLLPESGNKEASGRVLRARELAEQLAAIMPVPTDRAGVAAYLQTVSYEWGDNIRGRLNQLADRDLAALSLELPERVQSTPVPTFKSKITASLRPR